ncbi:glycosyltransferase [Rhizosphaericola mali]|uniref:Glycosyltransferase n=1 Tax=Rhizosphaericola mali TaxID=2545455 RepID=A0A5P2G603_9BACT|nr:glycosyltransferase [Rhizosphaericola mali]QES89160.1 glycosyltransferase [Rhizosphaericola mali]
MNTAKKILFVTKHPAHSSIAMAGNQLFNHTLNSFCKDSNFEIGWIYAGKWNDDFAKMKEAFQSNSRDFSVKIPKIITLFTGLYYRTSLRLFFARRNPSYYLLDPIYGHFYKKGLGNVKKTGWYPDWIVLEWTEVLFLLPICKSLFPNAKIAVTEHDVSFVKLQRRFAHKELNMQTIVDPFKKLELKLLSDVNLIRVLSLDDKNILIDNGIHSDKIELVAPYYHRVNLERKAKLLPQIVFYGALNREENKEAVNWFIEHVYQAFQLEKKVKLIVIGGGGAELKQKWSNLPGVEFAGYVKEPEKIFLESVGMVVPLLNGGGIKIKVLESMTCSLPVMTNSIGIEGIRAEDKVSYLHCEQPKDYMKAVDLLLSNHEKAREIGNNGRMFVEQHFNYEKSMEEYKSILSR